MAIFNFRAIGPVFIASVGNYSVNIYNDAYTPIDTADMNQINVLGISRGIYYNLLECDDPTGFADFSEGFSGIHKEIVSGIKLKLGGADVSSSNPLPVAQTDGLSVSGTVTGTLAEQATSGIPTVLFTTSMLNYESITVQVTSAGTLCTIVYEGSEDGVNWQSTSGLTISNIGVSGNTTTSTYASILQFPRKASFFRARVLTYGSGTVSVVGTLSKVPVAQLGLTYIGGGISPEGGGAGTSPIAVGLECRTSSKTSVSNGTLVRSIATVDGRLITRLNSIPENEWVYAAASGGITNTTTAATLVAAQAAGVRNYLTSLQLSSDVLGAATEIAIRDGAGGAVLWRGKIGTAGIAGVITIQFSDPLKSTAATLLEVVTLTASVFGGVYVNAQGYKAP